MAYKRVSLADVATAAGVGKATASRALSERPDRDIGHATQERVRAAATALGYRPNRAAQALRTGQVRAFGLVTPVQDWAWWAPVVQGAATEAARRGFQLLVNPIEHTTRLDVITNHLADHALDGAVIMTDSLLDLPAGSARTLPVVLIDDIDPQPLLPTIRSANWSGGHDIGRHLLSRGRTHPIVVLTDERLHYVAQRLAGFRAAYQEAGLEIDDSQILTSHQQFDASDDPQTGIPRDLERLAGTFDSVFATADYLAATVIRSLRHQRLVVPDDVAVVGYDDERAALLLDPPLTTIRQPLHEMGAAAITTLITMLAGDDTGPAVHELPGKLIIREST